MQQVAVPHRILGISALLFAVLVSGFLPLAARSQAATPVLFIGTCLVPGTATFRWQGLNGPVAAEWRLQLQPAGPAISLGLLQPGEIVGGYTADILTTTTEGIWKKQHFDGVNWISAIGQNFTSVADHTAQGLLCPSFPTPTVSPTPSPTPSSRPTPSPIATPTPTVTPTPAAAVGGGPIDDPDCCPGPDEPTSPVVSGGAPIGAVKGSRTQAVPTPTPVMLETFPSAGLPLPPLVARLFLTLLHY